MTEDLKDFQSDLEEQTGITPEEEAQAEKAQKATEKTIISAAQFAADRLTPHPSKPTPEIRRESQTKFLIPPYSTEELSAIESQLQEANIQIRSSFENYKPHLLASLIFASRIGINISELLENLQNYIEQKMKTSYHYHSGINHQEATYFIQEQVVKKLAEEKTLEIPPDLKPNEDRKIFMTTLANNLSPEKCLELARYIASTSTEFRSSPFYFSGVNIFELTHSGPLRRQNIAIAIAQQPFDVDSLKDFLLQNGIRKDKFLLAMANPLLRALFPLATLLAKTYPITLQYSPQNKKELPIKDALEEVLERCYKETPLGEEPKGPFPLEEISAQIIIEGLEQLPQEDLETRFRQILSSILESEQPFEELEKVFPDINLFLEDRDRNSLVNALNALKPAINNPNQIPPADFWRNISRKPNIIDSSFFPTYLYKLLIQTFYRAGGQEHLSRWRDLIQSFVVSEGQKRNGEALKIVIINSNTIAIFDGNNPLFSLVKEEDGWYPTPYYGKTTRQPVFAIAGESYEELQRRIAEAKFTYEVSSEFLKEILRERLSEFEKSIYTHITQQINLQALNAAGIHPSHSSFAYRESIAPSFLQDVKYLIGSLSPYGIGIYDSIFRALIQHLFIKRKLNPVELPIKAPLTEETVTIKHPILELNTITWGEIQRKLKETGEDVRIPEVTIRNQRGFEIRTRAGVYETLLQLKEVGFDAVLGKTMAEEFNRQSARIYVEKALVGLGFLPENYQRDHPLTSLKEKQQRLYSKALELGFTTQLEKDYYLARTLSLPLTWKREKELMDFLENQLGKDEFNQFLNEIGIDKNYFETREIIEDFLNFASGWGWSQFDRSNEFPTYYYQQPTYNLDLKLSIRSGYRNAGEFAISTQAQKIFKAAKKTWENFLTEVKGKIAEQSENEPLTKILNLGKALASEIDRMSQAEVTEWAEKIIKGEIAAVGKDITEPIEVNTWRDFYEAIRQLMNTAKLVLIYRSEKERFGWEVSTDKDELS
ncbi:MAG: hypothetical protein KatS3mg090_0430 [Patescibacteria group bacterium]|nr:MAG: hypothetical protein KatS3mg090_0430 [Patescibacteria group bacterium]